MDGKLQGNIDGMILRDDRDWLIKGLWLTDMWGGNTSDPKNYSPKYQGIWYKDYRISDLSRINNVIGAENDLNGDEDTGGEFADSTNQLSLVQITPVGDLASNNLRFKWTPSSIARSFAIIAKNNSDGAVVYQKNLDRNEVYCNQSNDSCVVDGPALDVGRYRWSIKQYTRVSNKGFIDNSIAHFAVVSDGFDEPEHGQNQGIESRVDNITFSTPSGIVDGSNLVLKWSAIANADKYYIKIVGKNEKSNYLFGKSIFPSSCGEENGRCQIAVPELPKGSYVWMVRPIIAGEKRDYIRKDIVVS